MDTPESLPPDLTTNGFRIRLATIEDLDALCQLVVETMDDDPMWQYRFPWRKQHPKEHLAWTKRNWARFFKPTPMGYWVVHIFERQKNADELYDEMCEVSKELDKCDVETAHQWIDEAFAKCSMSDGSNDEGSEPACNDIPIDETYHTSHADLGGKIGMTVDKVDHFLSEDLFWPEKPVNPFRTDCPGAKIGMTNAKVDKFQAMSIDLSEGTTWHEDRKPVNEEPVNTFRATIDKVMTRRIDSFHGDGNQDAASDSEGDFDYEPVAFAVWLVPDVSKGTPLAGSSATAGRDRPDADRQRNLRFHAAVDSAKKRLLNPRFRERQMHLQYLGTHPSARRQGLAKNLLQVGIDASEAAGLYLTTYASAVGSKLYRAQGFLYLETLAITIPPEKEYGEAVVMARQPDSQAEVRGNGLVERL